MRKVTAAHPRQSLGKNTQSPVHGWTRARIALTDRNPLPSGVVAGDNVLTARSQ